MSFAAILVAITSAACFAVVLVRSRIVVIANKVSIASSAGVTAMLDSELDDVAKERAVQQAGLDLIKLSWQIGWRLVLALASVAGPIFVGAFAGLASQEESLGVLLRVDFIVIISIVAVGVGFLLPRRKQAMTEESAVNDANGYSAGDRLVHALAFSGAGKQKALARLDDSLFARRIPETGDRPPIFITSLARGGTTALLNALHDLPDIATHRYKDMPFITAPVLWSRLAGKRAKVVERERSHGDGMKIGLQSPEAFDEILWMLHWPEKYCETHIDLWRYDDFKKEAQTSFVRHFAKIARLRRPENTRPARYLSKNNANIARLPLLPNLFPQCQIVIPAREPSAHAASLFRQHKIFSQLHQEDLFSKRYMRDIGHFEFGSLHRPLAFNRNFLTGYDLDQPDYWLAYWITCFEDVATQGSDLLIVKQDSIRSAPVETMENLTAQLGLTPCPAKRWGSYFRQEPDTVEDDMFDASLLARAHDLYHDLSEQAL